MKRSILVLLAVALCAAFVASSAFAAVIGSRHDMTTGSGISGGTAGACSYCHIPHKATGAKAWSGAAGGTLGTIGTIGQLCYDCHNSGGRLGTEITVVTANPFATTPKHGLTVTNLPAADNMAGAGLPYVTSQITSGLIECSSCHDPHSTTAEPFLQASATDLNTLCTKCHGGRSSSGQGYLANTLGTHPVAVSASSSSTIKPVTVPTATMARAFRGSVASITGSGNAWTAGGHLDNNSQVNCTTCHAIHGLQATNQASNADPAYEGTSGSNVKALLAVGDNTTSSGLCEACHGVWSTGSPVAPGGTGTSHPVNVAVPDTEKFSAAAAPYNYGTSKSLCRSCHGVHPRTADPRDAAPNTPILYATHAGNFCQQCHPAGATFFTGGKHHPGTTDIGWGDLASMLSNAKGSSPQLDNTDWFGGSDLSGITCYNCHRAHNAADNTSILRIAKGAGYEGGGTAASPTPTYLAQAHWQAGCVACHTAYPSSFTANDNNSAAGKGSHYVGSLRNTTRNTVAAYIYQGTWPSGGVSVYGLSSGTATNDNTTVQIVCESCHRFNGTAPSNNHAVIESQGNGFVASSGAVGLCRTCHLTTQDSIAAAAGSWGTGFWTADTRAKVIAKTHPLEKIQSGTNVSPAKYPVLGGNVSYASSNTLVNCESCHVAHGALEQFGALILEGPATTNYAASGTNLSVPPAAGGEGWFPTAKDEAAFCLYCHTQ